MDFSTTQDYHIHDAAYSPQIVNEQDQCMGGADEQQNGQHNAQPSSSLTSPHEGDGASRYNSPNLTYQQQPSSRPGSGMGQPQQHYQDQHRQQQQQQSSKSSVVIKVGMVGDAQIGKTSLMVKYVEGSWDEDYIQTLGEKSRNGFDVPPNCLRRGQFHGEDNLNPEHGNHFLNLGSWWSTRIRQHATPGL